MQNRETICMALEKESSKLAKTLSKKILLFVVFLLALSIIVFWLARLMPGDPLTAYYGEAAERMNEEQRAAAMERLSLDQPIATQYFTWLKNALTGDFGISHQYKQDVFAVIGSLWFNTLLLGGLSYLLTFVFAILLGLFCATKEGGATDRIIYRVGTATSVIPSFFVALIAILVFSVNLHILPSSGAYSIGGGGFADRAVHLILPVSVMVLSFSIFLNCSMASRRMERRIRTSVAICSNRGMLSLTNS